MEILGRPLYAMLTTWPLFLTFLICSLITLSSYRRTRNATTLFIFFSFLSFATTYLIWGIRVWFVPVIAIKAEIYWYWIAVYFFGGLSLVFLDFATLKFLKTDASKNTLIYFLELIIIISFVGVAYLLLSGFETKEVLLSDVTDLDIADIKVKAYLFVSMGIYLGTPNYIFLRFLWTSDKTTFAYKKVKILEIGILLTSAGMGLDGVRIADNFGMTLIRWLVMAGGLVIMVGLLYGKKKESVQR